MTRIWYLRCQRFRVEIHSHFTGTIEEKLGSWGGGGDAAAAAAAAQWELRSPPPLGSKARWRRIPGLSTACWSELEVLLPSVSRGTGLSSSQISPMFPQGAQSCSGRPDGAISCQPGHAGGLSSLGSLCRLMPAWISVNLRQAGRIKENIYQALLARPWKRIRSFVLSELEGNLPLLAYLSERGGAAGARRLDLGVLWLCSGASGEGRQWALRSASLHDKKSVTNRWVMEQYDLKVKCVHVTHLPLSFPAASQETQTRDIEHKKFSDQTAGV